MPRRELKHPRQVEDWLVELGTQLSEPGGMILVGSGALLWHACQRGLVEPLPENSMDVDSITDSEEVARFCYEALIGSEFGSKTPPVKVNRCLKPCFGNSPQTGSHAPRPKPINT